MPIAGTARKIKSIYVDRIGSIYSQDGQINKIKKAGEMAMVDWFQRVHRFSNQLEEWNGKYVIEVIYDKECKEGGPR